MGAGAYAQPLSVAPVGQVVAGLPAGEGPVADFVMAVAGGGQGAAGVVVHIGGQVGVGFGQAAFGYPAAQRGAVLQSQGVK